MKKYILLIAIAYSSYSMACKDRIYPDHLPKNEIDQYSEIHEVWIQKIQLEKKVGWYTPPFSFQGKVLRELKGKLKSGQIFKGRTDEWDKVNAACPISLNEGSTYLLFMNGDKEPIQLRRKGSLFLTQSDPKYKTYREDWSAVVF